VPVEIHLDFVDLAIPSVVAGAAHNRSVVRLGEAMFYTRVTAGEADVIADAWKQLARELAA
jgi:hypothetical protein